MLSVELTLDGLDFQASFLQTLEDFVMTLEMLLHGSGSYQDVV